MASQFVIASKTTSTGTVTSSNVALVAMYHVESGTAGQIVLKNGDTDGNVQLDIDTAGGNRGRQVAMPAGHSIPFPDGLHVDTLNNVSSLTLFFTNED